MARPPGSATDLMKMLNVATMPIYVLDEQRRIRFANVCLLEWVDAANDEVVGLRCDYHHDVELDSMLSLATGLCPPPEAFVGRASRAVVACQSRGGQLSRRWADCLPLAADEKGGRGVLVVVDRDEVSVEFDRNSSNGESADLHELVREFYHAEQGRFSLGQLAGTSSAIRKARAQVRLAVQAVANVMVVGPSGSGREHVARTIYHAEQYQVERQILLPVECGLVDGEILQATIRAFGQRADDLGEQGRATLLLLEVEKLSQEAQRVLWDQLNVPGFNWRILSTARETGEMTGAQADKAFDHELQSFLSTLVIKLPPLSERAEDIPLLAQLFLEKRNAAGEKQVGGFSPESADRLQLYSWPNNTDELVEMARHVHECVQGPIVQEHDLPTSILTATEAASVPRPQMEKIDLDVLLTQIEQELITRAIRKSKGNKAAAARALGISRQRLLRRWQQFKLDPTEPDDFFHG